MIYIHKYTHVCIYQFLAMWPKHLNLTMELSWLSALHPPALTSTVTQWWHAPLRLAFFNTPVLCEMDKF